MKIQKSKSLLIKIAIGITLSCFVAMLVLPLVSQDNIYGQFEKYRHIFSLAVSDYFEDVDVVKLNEAAIRGMLQELDPHSSYITAKDMVGINEDMSGSFEGIGVSFSILFDTLVVESPIADGPSEKVGIIARDRIVNVDGNSIVGMRQDSITKLLKGPKGTIVKLDVYRPGTNSLLNFTVTRDKIPLYAIDAHFIIEGTDIGYIKVRTYNQTTHKELVEAGQKLRNEGMKKLILDLRGNGGGILDQAFTVADEFLTGGDTIVYTRGKKSKDNQAFVARTGQTMEDIPLIVLIDGGSASASEITAGSIQDLDRGLIVGVTSFGKGLVQRQYPIYSDGSAVRLTIARFYTASGRCIQRPFKDKDAWRRLTDRLELEEGANLEHTLDKLKKEESINVSKDKDSKSKKKDTLDKTINLDSIEVFYTRNGRPVLGGGGITPDYIIKHDSRKLSSLTTSLWGNAVFIEFVDKYVNEMREKYGNDFKKFNTEFTLTEQRIKSLQKFAKEKDIEWKDEEFEADKDFIEVRLKYILARALWNTNTAMQVTIPTDRQLNKALELFPLAEKIQQNKNAKK